jgi:PE family
MSFVFATPEYVAAASDLANIGSTISSANAAALGRTSGVLAAGADEVSTTRLCSTRTRRPIRRSAPRRPCSTSSLWSS